MKKYIVLILSLTLLLAGSVSANKVYPNADGFRPRLEVLENEYYTTGYCTVARNPAWVYYFVKDTPYPDVGERPSYFSVDRRVNNPVSSDDYTNTGYDRGHLAPNFILGKVGGLPAQEATFVMTNVIPQDPTLNRGLWKDLEMLIAKTYLKENEFMYIFTGPIYDFIPGKPRMQLESGVWIPDWCYKIIVDLDGFEFRVLSFMFPNKGPYTKLEDYLVSVDVIEKATGLDFLSDLPDSVEFQLEAVIPKTLWHVRKEDDEVSGN